MHHLLDTLQQSLDNKQLVQAFGFVRQVLGTLIEGVVPGVSVGELCEIYHPSRPHLIILSEVIGFTADSALLSPLSTLDGISSSFVIKPLRRVHCVAVGCGLMGRVLDGFGSPLDGLGPVATHGQDVIQRQVLTTAPPPGERPRISSVFSTGVRAVDAMLTVGQGQRVGVFAGPGCGKTTLMAAIGRGADVDVVVIGLIGERGREVRELTEHELDAELLKKTVIVCATSDRTAIERVRAAFTATAIAEAFRDKGLRVLLMIDSLTRLSRAQREIGLAAGEAPARAGFPPSVYALLPRLIERAGLTERGSITAFYTVLLEGELKTDPISEEAVSLLDGHILLSRKLAECGHYPAIDVLPSISRVMSNIVSHEHGAAAGKARQILSRYRDMELLIRLGEYKPGIDPETDALINAHPKVMTLLKQDTKHSIPWATSLQQLLECTRIN